MAVSAPVRRVIFTANESKKGVAQGREGIKNIGQVILKRTKVKREAFAQTNLFRKRREESEKRMMLEDELEAPRIAAIPTGAQQLVEKTGVGGFFNRILGFLGYLAAGWLMNNLPTWIAMGKEFIARIQKAGEIVSGFFNNTIKLFTGVGNLLSSLGQNLLQFDFFDTSNRVKNSMSELNNTMGSLTGQIEEAFSLLTTPLTAGKYSGEEIPETGTQQTDQGAYEEPPPYSGGGLPDPKSAEMYRIAAALTTEGRAGQSAADIMQVVVNRKASGKYGANYTDILAAPGQFAGVFKRDTKKFRNIQTLDDAAKWSGQSKATLLGVMRDIQDPAKQASAAKHVKGALEFRAAPQYYLKSGLVRGEMGPNGRFYNSSWRGSSGDNQFLQQSGKDPMLPGPASFNLPKPSQNKPTRAVTTTVRDEINVSGPSGGTPSVGLSKEAGAQYLASRPGGRKHAGIDIGTNGQRGYYVSFKQAGKVTYARNNGRGYGNLVIVKSGNIEFYFAHLASIMVKEGQSYNGQTIGEIGNTGGRYLIHLHFEARPNGNPVNPKPYLSLLSIGRQLTGIAGQPTTTTPLPPTPPTPAQIAAAPQQSQTVPSALTPERRGQDIIIVDQPRQQQNIITPASGGGGQGPSPISDFDLLNNFIKNKLLLDLAYL